MNRASDSGQTERLAKDLLDRAREEITHAENKASILLAGVLAAVGGVIAAISGVHWPVVRQPSYVAAPFWAAAVAAIAAIVGLASAVYPRIAPSSAGRTASVGFFGDVVELESPAELRRLLTHHSTTVFDVWIDQAWQTSLIARQKYRLVCWSIRLLGCALFFTVVVGIGATVHGG